MVTIKKGSNELTLKDNDDDVVDIIITSYNIFNHVSTMKLKSVPMYVVTMYSRCYICSPCFLEYIKIKVSKYFYLNAHLTFNVNIKSRIAIFLLENASFLKMFSSFNLVLLLGHYYYFIVKAYILIFKFIVYLPCKMILNAGGLNFSE